MLTIVFYSVNGQAAKLRAREICAQSKGNYARVYDVAAWDGTPDKCDDVEIMPDVPGWQRKRITAAFGEVQETIVDEEEIIEQENPDVVTSKENNKKPVHRGGGRWFVMDGKTVLSGPHDKAEAARLAVATDEVSA
jgi:hypothetical protein